MRMRIPHTVPRHTAIVFHSSPSALSHIVQGIFCFRGFFCSSLHPHPLFLHGVRTLLLYLRIRRVRAYSMYYRVSDRQPPTPAACFCLRRIKHAIYRDRYGPSTNNTRNNARCGRSYGNADTCPSGQCIFPLPRA